MSNVTFQKETPEAETLHRIDAELRSLDVSLRYKDDDLTQYERSMADSIMRSLVRRRSVIVVAPLTQ